MADFSNTLVKGSLYVTNNIIAVGKISGPLNKKIITQNKTGTTIKEYNNTADVIINPAAIGLNLGGSGSATVNQTGTTVSKVISSVSMNTTTGYITVSSSNLDNVVIGTQLKAPKITATEIKTENWTMSQSDNDLVFTYA